MFVLFCRRELVPFFLRLRSWRQILSSTRLLISKIWKGCQTEKFLLNSSISSSPPHFHVPVSCSGLLTFYITSLVQILFLHSVCKWFLLRYFATCFCSPSGPGSSVGIATLYGLDGPEIESRWGRDFPHLSRPTLGPTQSPVQCVPDLSRGLRAAGVWRLTPHPLLVPRSRKSRAIILLPLWAVRPVQSLSACTRAHFLPKCSRTLRLDTTLINKFLIF